MFERKERKKNQKKKKIKKKKIRKKKKKKLYNFVCEMSQEDNKYTTVLGEHTCIPSLTRANEKIQAQCNLLNTKGKLPPYLIVVGDRRRVLFAAKYLDNCVLIHDIMKENGLNNGRVNIALGTYKGVPIAIAETQMGCSAVEINVKELTSNICMTKNFNNFHADSKYVIRVGSCAGINPSVEQTTDNNKVIKGFDIVICNKQVGISGADYQALSGKLNFFDKDALDTIKTKLKKLNYTFKDNLPYISLDNTLVNIMKSQAINLVENNTKLDNNIFTLGNISKDSLYAETNEEEFTHYRDNYSVGSSEMEMAMLCRLAQEKNIYVNNDSMTVGMVCMVLGCIPGISFYHDPPKEKLSQELCIKIALESLYTVAMKHQTIQ